MTYVELSIFGRLRKIEKYGQFGMFQKLLHSWGDKYSPREIYEKTRRFFYFYVSCPFLTEQGLPIINCTPGCQPPQTGLQNSLFPRCTNDTMLTLNRSH
jgi:hypothetical protein